MAKIVEKRICSECKKEYDWEYILAHKLSDGGIPDCEEIIQGFAHPQCLSFHSEEPNYRFSIRCPYCDNLESFDYAYQAPKIRFW